MNLRNKLKKFFTLNPRHEAGFTLVELIVVIAILAILGGVGSVGYSAYVKKANEAADKQLIADIEKALLLGAYSGNYAPGTVVGAVGISKDGNATAKTTDFDNDSTTLETDIADMMEKAFGAGWEETLRLKSDLFTNSDSAKMIAAIKNNPTIFASVPDSSFYATEGGTDSVVGEVDDLATALNKVLSKMSADLTMFWGDTFTGEDGALAAGGITSDTWKENDQMAANLSVFAVANEVVNNPGKISDWKSSWTTGGATTVSGIDGYVADLAMQYAKCVAYMNYAEQNYANDPLFPDVKDAYVYLQSTMQKMDQADTQNRSYLQRFNDAIAEFWTAAGSYKDTWQSSGQAAKDADAFIATMTAVNTLEGTYVSKDKADVLSQSKAFEAAGAADILDAMVSYAELGDALPEDGYVVVLRITKDGTPDIKPTMQEE